MNCDCLYTETFGTLAAVLLTLSLFIEFSRRQSPLLLTKLCGKRSAQNAFGVGCWNNKQSPKLGSKKCQQKVFYKSTFLEGENHEIKDKVCVVILY